MKDSTIRIALLGPAVAALLACGSVNPLEASLDRPGQSRSASPPAPSPAGVDRDADDDGASAIEATIMEIQGEGADSPLAGELVRTTGVVTLETASAGSFWMQDSVHWRVPCARP